MGILPPSVEAIDNFVLVGEMGVVVMSCLIIWGTEINIVAVVVNSFAIAVLSYILKSFCKTTALTCLEFYYTMSLNDFLLKGIYKPRTTLYFS